MKDDDELKEFLGKLFSDFEAEPAPKAWENIQQALSTAPRAAAWPKIITGALIGVLCSGICHAPVHSQLSELKTKTTGVTSALKELKDLASTSLATATNEKPLKNIAKTLKFAEFHPTVSKENSLVKPTISEVKSATSEENQRFSSVNPSETKALNPAEATTAFQPELLNVHEMKVLPSRVATPQVDVLAQPKKVAGSLKLWSVSVMPLATYQRMYILPEANDRINTIHGSQSLNGHRTGLRIGTELTLLRDRSSWRFGLSFTQMRQRLQYSLSTNQYTLSTAANAEKPMVSQQTAQTEEVNRWHLLGLRADRQYQLATNGRQRYFVSLGTEGAIDLAGRQPYLWGHLSVGVQKLLTPRVWMSVEPTASYSLISRTANNGLFRVNPYNFGVKVSLGLMP